MQGLIFVIPIVAILIILYRRKRTKRKAKDQQLHLPGRTPASAEMIHHKKQIKIFVRQQRCHCGGKVYICAQSKVELHGLEHLDPSKDMRVAVCECTRCEDVHRFYFEMEYLN